MYSSSFASASHPSTEVATCSGRPPRTSSLLTSSMRRCRWLGLLTPTAVRSSGVILSRCQATGEEDVEEEDEEEDVEEEEEEEEDVPADGGQVVAGPDEVVVVLVHPHLGQPVLHLLLLWGEGGGAVGRRGGAQGGGGDGGVEGPGHPVLRWRWPGWSHREGRREGHRGHRVGHRVGCGLVGQG